MSNQILDITNLVPDLSLIVAGDFNTAAGFSALLVSALGVIFVAFLGMTILSFLRARRQLGFYENLIKGLKVEELTDKRREITQRALEYGAYGQLWREFDESLVDIPQKKRLCNTLDAAHFFNTHTLAKGLTENRLIAAVPGFLTAIGVIGTFAGLQMGLVELDGLNPETATSQELTQGIFGMIGGASIAFMTSVWGILFSVSFNFIEKWFERNIRNAISNFQNRIDFLYPRITAEQSLSNIEDFSRQSMERLAELDEKIGHRLQEAMRETSAAIQQGLQDSLNNVLGPAIDQLVNNANSGSEKALSSLMDRYLEGIGDLGTQQRQLLEGATDQLGNTAHNMTQGMDNFLDKLDGHVDSLSQKNETALATIHQQFTEQLEAQQEKDNARQLVINDQIRRMGQSQGDLSNNLERIVSGQDEQFGRITDRIDEVMSRFQQLLDSHNQATSAMKAISGDMQGASNQLGVLSQNTREANVTLKETTTTLVESLEKTAVENQRTLEESQRVNTSLTNLLTSMDETVTKLQRATEFADSGFRSIDSHFSQLGTTLREHVSQLEQQVAGLLNEYSSQVQAQTIDRLNAWNEQTSRYTSDMTRVVQTLSSVVDEMESKLSA